MAHTQDNLSRKLGGRLALDFVNTADWQEDGTVRRDHLKSIDDLHSWAAFQGLSSAPLKSDLEEVITLRAALRAAFLGRSAGLPDTSETLIWGGGVDLDRLSDLPLTAHILASAISILADDREFSRLGVCPGSGCGWMFIDESRNGRRRWCSMEICGNRAKAKRHYAKTQSR